MNFPRPKAQGRWPIRLATVLLAALICVPPVSTQPAARPNIVLIYMDDLGYGDTSAYGATTISTPNIDALARNGVRFNAACSTYPVCVPYRFTVMTGEFAHTRFIPAIEWRMSPAERTLADEFNDAGYDTALFGKWHLYGGFGHLPGYTVVKTSRSPIPRPFQGRWKRFSGFDICNDPYDTYIFNNEDPTPHKLEKFQTDSLFDMAMEYLAEPEDRKSVV